MARTLYYHGLIELPTRLPRWAAGFDKHFVDGGLAFTPGRRDSPAYVETEVEPRSVWKAFLALPLDRPITEAIRRVVNFVEKYGVLSTLPATGDDPPVPEDFSAWRALQREARAASELVEQRVPGSLEDQAWSRFLQALNQVPRSITLGAGTTRRPIVSFRMPDLRSAIWLGQFQVWLEANRRCVLCGRLFRPTRRDNIYCSPACRARQHRLSS